MPNFPHLLSPGRIGTLELKNRLCQTAMGTNFANEDGTVGDETIGFYGARAAGGTAMLIMGTVGVANPVGRLQERQVSIADDSFIPGLKRLTDAIHDRGGRLCAQLNHGGVTSLYDMAAGRPVIVPSLPRPSTGAPAQPDIMLPEELARMPGKPELSAPPNFKEADEDDIAWIIEAFASGAARAVEAGYDAIELHGGHTYLLNSFLSPSWNRRTDRYGGSPEGRAQLLKEVIEGVRGRIGRDFPMQVKINAEEYHYDENIALEDAIVTARIAEAAGADAITVTTSHNYAVSRALLSSWMPQIPNKLLPLAAAIRAAVNLPVITVGRVDPEAADKAIAEGKLDFLAQGRKQIADDAFVSNLARGGKQSVRPCIFCYQCLSQSMMGLPLRCAVNADVGYETGSLLAPVAAPRKVVVVGGGPGGMEAARRLTLRGHTVTLLEASLQLGGTARIAAIAHAPNGDFVDWLKDRLDELKIDVRLGVTASVETIRALAPDAVIVATGATRLVPDIEGKDLPHVHRLSGLEAFMEAERPKGHRIVVIGGDAPGMQLAERLGRDGCIVAVIDEEPQFGRGLSPARRQVMLGQMPLDGIALHEGASKIVIGESSVRFTDKHGEACEASTDTVIIAKGAEPNTGLYDELAAAGIEAHMVGDCQGVGYIIGAVRNAADVATSI